MKQALCSYIPSPVVAVVAYYPHAQAKPEVHVCGVRVNSDDSLTLTLGCHHTIETGQLVTIHLDNRTGVSDYDADLSVYRLSYKGTVSVDDNGVIQVEPIQFQVFYGVSIEYEYSLAGYQFPDDPRAINALPTSPLSTVPDDDPEEHDNKVGVLVTCAQRQPHTTVMAFLSSDKDDIFFITFANTFKSQLLKRDSYCLFAIDNRATFTFEQAIQWNYTIISGYAHDVPKHGEVFNTIRERFIAKNPWEIGFFSHPDVEMYHITPDRVYTPDTH